MAKPALGRGLGALLGGTPIAKPPSPGSVITISNPGVVPEARPGLERVSLSRIRPCPLQPRKDFSPEALRELADSIKEQGIVQPLVVRERDGYLELIAGERRWRAAQLLGLDEVPIIIREADDRAVLELALIENLQRENLNPIEEAQGYAQLIDQFGLTQEEVALKVGKSRTAVANGLRLLKLPITGQNCLRDGRITVGHAKVVLGLAGEKQQQLAIDRILREGLNVRQTETLVGRLQQRAEPGDSKKIHTLPTNGDPHVANVEDRLRQRLGTKVHLKYARGKGSIEISFFSDDDLERLLQILGVSAD